MNKEKNKETGWLLKPGRDFECNCEVCSDEDNPENNIYIDKRRDIRK